MFPDVLASWPEEVEEMIVTDCEEEEEEELVPVIVLGSVGNSFVFIVALIPYRS